MNAAVWLHLIMENNMSINLLKNAYEASSEGEWISKRTTFTAKDRDFANLAHNMMPRLLEAVSYLDEMCNQADEDTPQESRTEHFTATLVGARDLLKELEGFNHHIHCRKPDEDDRALKLLTISAHIHETPGDFSHDEIAAHISDLGEFLASTEETYLNDRYADAVISNGRAVDFDAIEIHGVRAVNESGTICEINDNDPDTFSVYVHRKEGGIECVGDFSNAELATSYAEELGSLHTWKVYSFILNPVSKIQIA